MTRQDHPDLPFAPPLAFIVPFLCALLLEWAVPTHFAGGLMRWLPGAALLAGGMAFVLAGAIAQRRAGTDFIPDRPTTCIVDTGVYRLTRNPMYLGFALATAGLAFLLDNSWALLSVAVGVGIIDRLIVRREERYLEGKFADGYIDYKRRVRRWL